MSSRVDQSVYFDLDAEIVYNVVKSNLPEMLVVVEDM